MGLALLTPDDTLLVAAVATVCVFLTIYYLPVSYPKMVFWLNIGFVMVYTRLGAQEFDLLINRPYATLLGAVVAAGVVLFVFPVHIGDRFKVAATQFLGAVDGYVAVFVALKSDEDWMAATPSCLTRHRRGSWPPMPSWSRRCRA